MSYLNDLLKQCFKIAVSSDGRLPGCSESIYGLSGILPYSEMCRINQFTKVRGIVRYSELYYKVMWSIASKNKSNIAYALTELYHTHFCPTNNFLETTVGIPSSDVKIMGYLFRLYFSASADKYLVINYVNNCDESSFYNALPNRVMSCRFSGMSRRDVMRMYLQHLTYEFEDRKMPKVKDAIKLPPSIF